MFIYTERQVFIDVELALKRRILHKWSVLKTSTDKELLEKFLNEIIVSLTFK